METVIRRILSLLKVNDMVDLYSMTMIDELFQQDPNETDESALKRAEHIYDSYESTLLNLIDIISHKSEIETFFEKCIENKQRLIKMKNNLISDILKLKKRMLPEEDYEDEFEEWDVKREETEEQRNVRLCLEMVSEMKEQQDKMEKTMKKMKEERKNLKKQRDEMKIELETLQKKQSEMDSFKDFQNNKAANFVRKEELNTLISQFVKRKELAKSTTLAGSSSSTTIQYDLIEEQVVDEKYNLTPNEIKQLEEWTMAHVDEILFDSKEQGWKKGNCELNKCIKGHRKMLFLIEDDRGEKFGYYLNTQIKLQKYYEWEPTDIISFHFNISSSNKRLKKPTRFEIKDTKWGGYMCFKENDDELIRIGDICIYKEHRKGQSYCTQDESRFQYHSVLKALCGKAGTSSEDEFIPLRIIVIQMKESDISPRN